MKATEAPLLEFLQGTKQFIIPIYQRTYSWTTAQCQQLWQDILRAGNDEHRVGHFIGSFVYIKAGLYQVTAVPQLLVIDGQQRMTTLMLLLHAIKEQIVAREADTPVTAEEISAYYLLNIHKSGDYRYKLLLTQADRDTLIRLIDGKVLPEHPATRILANLAFFAEQLKLVDLSVVLRGLSKLLIVDISLDRDHDNPQLIFESLNSTGLDLSQADLIRNYILMGLEPDTQKAIYDEYWYPMEQRFAYAGDAKAFDRFMRDYLTIKNRQIPNIDQVYSVFKVHAESLSTTSIREVVRDIARFASYFERLAFGTEPDPEIRKILADINTLKVDVAYPFLLEVYVDYEDNTVDRDALIAILRMVESYVFRRLICGIPTNSLNKTYSTLARDVDKADYLASAEKALVSLTSYRRFPTDEEFSRELVVKNVYSMRNLVYLLGKLENHGHKELVEVRNYTVEHIMPQNPNLSSEWQAALGPAWQEVQSRYLHTLGNLTLTGYNSELSDRPFIEKRDMQGGFATSPIRLNQSLSALSSWNEEEIERRGATLAALAVEVWPRPAMAGIPADGFIDPNVLALAERVDASMRPLFFALRQRILDLDPGIAERGWTSYLLFRAASYFGDIGPSEVGLFVGLDMPFAEVHDPTGLCRDVTKAKSWGRDKVAMHISSLDQLDDVIYIVHQAYDLHADDDE